MKTLCVAFPILPGKVAEAREFANAALAQSEELSRSFERIGIRREEWFVQESPQGAMILVNMRADDPEQALANWAMSHDPFDCWFKSRASEISGIDFNEPLTALPQRVFAWQA